MILNNENTMNMILAILEKLLIITFLTTFAIQEVSSIYGYPCDSTLGTRKLCNSYFEICKNFKCECSNYLKFLSYDNAVADCRFDTLGISQTFFYTTADGFTHQCPDDHEFKSSNCVCKKKNHVRVQGECMESVIQSPMEKCFISEKAYICNVTASTHCVNGTCDCFPNFQYNETTNECFTTLKNLTADSCFDRCLDHQKCVNDKCVCKNDSHIEVDGICSEPVVQLPMERCYTFDNTSYICNKTMYTYCNAGICLCLHDYYYNATLGECLTRKSYMDLYGIKDYKALPGGYCVNNGDCVEGLYCRSYKCNCPRGCDYKQKDFKCDCGSVSLETPPNIIGTGLALGLISLLFWACAIKRTIANFRKKPRIQSTNIPARESEPHPVSEPSTLILLDTDTQPDPVPPPSRGNYQPYNDLPPSYDEAIKNDPLSHAPIGFCGFQNKNSKLAYPLKPISTDTPTDPSTNTLSSDPPV